ncbi:signal peptidase II [Spiroplasma endosymbiont of Anurida maritima]|uniref:signal peptidase II n=1 Tax=Spiroplasma endosymbiont of Anurida maritima TaxID=2967972 RepID=UPI0036D2AB92
MKNYFVKFQKHLKTRNFNWKFKLIVCLPIILGLIIIDAVTKQIALDKLSFFEPDIEFIKDFIHFKLIINYGSAFGLNSDNTGLTIFLATFVSIMATIAFLYLNNKLLLISLSIIISGAYGNLIDRMWNDGGVVDFLFWVWFEPYSIFNLADVFVNVGVVLLFVAIFVEAVTYYKNKKNEDKNLDLNKINEIKKQHLEEKKTKSREEINETYCKWVIKNWRNIN